MFCIHVFEGLIHSITKIQGTGANSDPGKFAHGFISHFSKIQRFDAFCNISTSTHSCPTAGFIGIYRKAIFLLDHWTFAFQRFFCFQTIWFEVASTPNFLFSHLQRHLLAILARSFIRVSQERVRSQKFQEHVRSVASTACQKLQTQKKVWHKKNAREENVITPRPTPPKCASLYMCWMLVNVITTKGKIWNWRFPLGSLAARLANTSICVSHSNEQFHKIEMCMPVNQPVFQHFAPQISLENTFHNMNMCWVSTYVHNQAICKMFGSGLLGMVSADVCQLRC